MSSKNKEAVELSRLISEFITNYVPLYITNSQNTVKSYETAMTLYIGYLENVCNITPIKLNKECFSQKYIEGWLKWLSIDRQCSVETCNARLSVIRAFNRYLSSRDVKYLPLVAEAESVPYKKSVKKKMKGLSKQAIKAVLAEPNPNTKFGLRDLTLMVILYGTAARIDELLSIQLKDIHLEVEKPCITIIGKGGKPRNLFLLPKAIGFLTLYLKVFHGNQALSTDYLFFSSIKGKQTKVSQQAVFKMLRRYAAKAHAKCSEVPENLHAHQFRHAKATHWLEDGMNILQISSLLGHSSIETTMKYLDITTEQEKGSTHNTSR